MPVLAMVVVAAMGQSTSLQIGREVAVPVHLQDGEEFTTSVRSLIEYGSQLFNAKFTIQKAQGVPCRKELALQSPIRAPRWCFRGISTESLRLKQMHVLVVTMRPSPVVAATV